MKLRISLLLLLMATSIWPVFANTGDFENRIREAEAAGDRQKVASICQEWYASGQYSHGLLNWNYNALMSVEQGALLFTQQESDTYPALLLQYALGVRQDVSILSFQLLENQDYRALAIAMENLGSISKGEGLSDFIAQVMRKAAENGKPLYFGSMTNKNLLLADKEKLYLTGLALKYSPQPFDNVATLRYNFETQFRTDYLLFNLAPEANPDMVSRANLNYVPALVLLHRHYAAAGEIEKADKMQRLAQSISQAAGKESEVMAFFAPATSPSAFVSGISAKALEKNMKKVAENLYASDVETTNAQYEAFLQDLLKNKDFEQLERCKTIKTNWVSLLPTELQGLPNNQLFEHGHPDGPGFPVQNISHEAAQRYCAWMTQVYNASTEKKKFKKVVFRLPTEAEWMAAARAGRKDVPYPWGGYFVRNSKGCYLGNYHAIEPCGNCPSPINVTVSSGNTTTPTSENITGKQKAIVSQQSNDGGFFPVKADSYFPNDFGLYAMSGNVAEMIAEPGKSKGGSWQDDPYYGQIGNLKEYHGPSPALGFRVFMEVIEK